MLHRCNKYQNYLLSKSKITAAMYLKAATKQTSGKHQTETSSNTSKFSHAKVQTFLNTSDSISLYNALW